MLRAPGWIVTILTAAVFLARGVLAQGELSLLLVGESRQGVQLLEEVQQKFAENKIGDAIDLLATLLDRSSDELIALKGKGPPGIQTLSSLRYQVHTLICQLPEEVLNQVRRRQDVQAQRWLDQGLIGPNPQLLQQVIDRAFCSRPAEKAIDTLGDLAFEQGDFDTATYWWQFLLPPLPGSSGVLFYPQPQQSPARTRAKLLLARLFQDGPEAIRGEWKAFQSAHGSEKGHLAGGEGNYADRIAQLSDWMRQSPARGSDTSWATFSANVQRNALRHRLDTSTSVLDQLGRQTPTIVDLTTRRLVAHADGVLQLRQLGGVDLPAPRDLRLESTTQMASRLAFHPVISADQVIVADGRIITAMDLNKKTISTLFDFGLNKINPGRNGQPILFPPTQYTLSLADGSIYARLGSQLISSRNPDAPGVFPPETSLVCLQLNPPAGSERLQWRVQPGEPGQAAVFEGAPLIDEDHAWIASTRLENDIDSTRIHCYPARSRGSPQPIWIKEITQVRHSRSSEPARSRLPLLTSSGPLLLYLNHQGALVALERYTGKRIWSLRYPSWSSNADHPSPSVTNPIDIGPCLAYGPYLYLAPADSDLLLCLDRTTGQVIWQRERLMVNHLLGVTTPVRPGGTSLPLLYLTTNHGLMALDARTGKGEYGWRIPDSGGSLPSLGRGLLFGNLILWPTVKGILAINQADGSPVSIPNLQDNVLPGNLALTSRCLAVTTRSHLFVYTLDSPAP